MAKEWKFSGSSDDIFEAAGDEFYAPYAALIFSSEGSLVVRAFYADGQHNQGVWCIGVEPVDEDAAIPEWPARFCLAENGYSAELVLTVPDDARVKQIGRPE